MSLAVPLATITSAKDLEVLAQATTANLDCEEYIINVITGPEYAALTLP